LSEKDDLLRKAKEEMRLSERILSVIPGFKGYKEKEVRRESDRLIRNHLYRRLKESEDDLKKVFQRLSDERLYGPMENMDRLVMEFDRVKARIDHASYGYSGFFDILKIEENDLDEMLSFDSSLVDEVEALSKEIKALKEVKPEEVNSSLESIKSSLSKIEEAFNERNEKILGVK
jgi:archaellum component FlaC